MNGRHNNREELRQRIIVTSRAMFMRNGIRQVKMDDIAHKLSISKRTLYEIFANKEQLLLALFEATKDERQAKMRQIAQTKHDVIEILVEFYRMQTEELMAASPVFFADVAKYPSLVEMLKEQREHQTELYLDFMKRGVSEGMFRSDVSYTILYGISLAAGDYVMASGLYNTYSLEFIFRNILFILLRGICTDAGIRRLDELLLQM